MGKILVDDIFKFLALFANFIFAFYCALYFVYPTADGFEPVGLAREFNEWHGALMTTMQLAFLGAEFDFVSWAIPTPTPTPNPTLTLTLTLT